MRCHIHLFRQIFSRNMTTHPLLPLEERALGKIIDSSFVTNVDWLLACAIEGLELFKGERFKFFRRNLTLNLNLFSGCWSFFNFPLSNSKFIFLEMVSDSLNDMESFIEPFEHLMSSFESQATSVQFNTVADHIHETEPLPEESFSNAGLEMIDVIDGRPRVKIRRLLGEDPTQSKGQVGFPRGEVIVFVP